MSKYKLYVTYWNPNGTSDLVVYNTENGDIVDSLNEACFGQPLSNKTELEGHEHLELFKISVPDVLRYISVSPMHSEARVIDFLKKYGFVKDEDKPYNIIYVDFKNKRRVA